jgi:2-aminoethylphosphonate-pyruvate transaminase
MQGSGTYSIEAVIQQISNEKSNFLIIENGLYGRKLALICDKSKIKYDLKSFPENRTVDLIELENFLKKCSPDQYTTVGVIHGETSSGVLNRIENIGPLIKKYFPSKSTHTYTHKQPSNNL